MTSSPGFDPNALAGKLPTPGKQVDVLVVGGGPAGAAAAIAAAQGGASVMLVDENPVGAGLMGSDVPLFYGGRYTQAVAAKARMMEQVFAANPALEAAFEAGVEVELGVYCWGAFTPGEGLASLPCAQAGLADEERAWMVGFKRLILATGARDVALAFPGWDQPGVMGARAFESLVDTYDAFAGHRIVVLGSGALAVDTARRALARGLEVAALIEVEDAPRAAAPSGVEVLASHTPIRAEGGVEGVEQLIVRGADGVERTLSCDTIVQAVALTPVVDLTEVAGARLVMQPSLGGHAPVSADGVSTTRPDVFVAGDAAGVPGGISVGVEAAQASGRRAAAAALASLGLNSADESPPPPAASDASDAVAYAQAWVRALGAVDPEVIVCQCEEVSRAALLAVRQPLYLGVAPETTARHDLGDLVQGGPADPNQIKRLTRAGMGLCQGRRCREQVALTLAGASNTPPSRTPLSGYRAPVRPLPLSVLADWEEAAAMSGHWDVWFGIPTQWTPYADIGTEREAEHAAILGDGMHL